MFRETSLLDECSVGSGTTNTTFDSIVLRNLNEPNRHSCVSFSHLDPIGFDILICLILPIYVLHNDVLSVSRKEGAFLCVF